MARLVIHVIGMMLVAGGICGLAFAGDSAFWIDVKTGKRVKTFPAALSVVDYKWQAGNIASSGQAHSSATGQNFFSTDGGLTWSDSRTGRPVATVPGALSVEDYRLQVSNINSSRHASSSITHQTFVLIDVAAPGHKPLNATSPTKSVPPSPQVPLVQPYLFKPDRSSN